MTKLFVLAVLPAICLAVVDVTSSGSSGLSFHYDAGDLAVEVGPDGSARLDLRDADHLAQPGEFDLPAKVVMVGLPQEGSVRLAVGVSGEQTKSNVVLGTVPHIAWEPCSTWYDVPPTRAGIEPSAWAEIGPIQVLRGVRVATVKLNPVRYNPATRQLAWVQSMDVRLEFSRAGDSRGKSDPLDGSLSRMLLNGEQAKDWKLDEPAAMVNPYGRSQNWLKVLVDSTAMYGISGRDLARAGVPIDGLDPLTLALYTVGEHEPSRSYPQTLLTLPILVRGEEDGKLNPEDRIIFYGLGPNHWQDRGTQWVKSYYTRHNVYWLSWGGARGRRIDQGLPPDTAGTPVVRIGRETVHQERDLDCPARSGLLWIWTQMFKPQDRSVTSFETDLDLAGPSMLDRLSGCIIADAAGNELSVLLNGRTVGGFAFNQAPPMAPYTFVADTALPLNFLRNKLTLELRGDSTKRLYLDYLEIDYVKRLSLGSGQLHFLQDDTGTFRFAVGEVPGTPVILDVTDHYSPKQSYLFDLAGDSLCFCRQLGRPSEFAIACDNQLRSPDGMELRRPGRLLSPLEQADYWIVTPNAFLPAAEQLARYRTGHIAGIERAEARVATLEDIYDSYSFGMEEPGAIKRFFADKRPVYGLLAGDATCDYRGILNPAKPGVPSWESGFGLNPDALDRTSLAYDAWYADFEGEGASPDMVLARVTVRTGEEFARFVRKVISYENDPAGFWNKRFLLVADDEFDGGEGWPDPIGFTHIYQCESMGVLPDNLLQPVKVYLTEYPYLGVKSKPAAHAEFMRQMNRGGLLLAFFGHGSGFDLTHESVLNITQVPQVQNQGRVPFCFFGSCSVGRFEDTQYECIAEDLVRMDGGAIGAVGATKATTSASNLVFARNLFTPLLGKPDSTIGISFFAAWPTDRIYHLFGDPATVLRIPRPSSQQLAVTPETLRPGADFRARAIVETPRAEFSWVLSGPRRVRVYRSSRGEASYTLPGLELARGTGHVRDGNLSLRGVFPMGAALDTLFTANGYYAPVVRSCRLSASVTSDSVDLSVLGETLTYSEVPAERNDHEGPSVTLLMDGRPLEDGGSVPSELELEVMVSDPSGILVAPVAGSEPLFYVDDRRGAVDITDLLVFDDSSFTTARCRLPLRLDGPSDSLFVIVSDNMLNRTVSCRLVHPLGSGVLKVDSALVYPNPVDRACRFTFLLTQPASVRVRVYTLAGRLVRDLGDQAGSFGYNEVAWDGRDRDGNLLPNGIYLYSVNARSDQAGGAQSVTVRDRLIVMR